MTSADLFGVLARALALTMVSAGLAASLLGIMGTLSLVAVGVPLFVAAPAVVYAAYGPQKAHNGTTEDENDRR